MQNIYQKKKLKNQYLPLSEAALTITSIMASNEHRQRHLIETAIVAVERQTRALSLQMSVKSMWLILSSERNQSELTEGNGVREKRQCSGPFYRRRMKKRKREVCKEE